MTHPSSAALACLLAGAGLATSACAGAEAGGRHEASAKVTGVPETSARLDSSPLTVTLHPAPELSRAIANMARDTALEGESTHLRLSVEGIGPPTSGVGVRVFLNLPEANATTSLDDPHYLGSFTFHGSPPGEDGQPAEQVSFLLDAGPTVARLAKEFETEPGRVHVTLVAAPLRPGTPRRTAPLSIQAVTLSLHR